MKPMDVANTCNVGLFDSRIVVGRFGRLRAVDLFCGAGGASYGAQKAGAEIVAAVDCDPIAAATFEDNFPSAAVKCERLDGRIGPKVFGDIGPVDVLLASPECTNHSVARGSRTVDLESQQTASYIIPFVEEWEPDFVVVENVSRMRRWEGYGSFLGMLKAAGYFVDPQLLDASDFAVPQSRKRLFLICSRLGPPPKIEALQPGVPLDAKSVLDAPGTHAAKPVFGRTKPLAVATMDRIGRGRACVPQDDFLVVYYGTDAVGGWQRLDRPLRTVTTLDRFALVSGTGPDATLRMLQVSELKRAMGLPEGFRLARGSRRDQIRLLGNAVCAPVMTAIIRNLMLSKEDQLQTAQRELFTGQMLRDKDYVREGVIDEDSRSGYSGARP